MFIWLFIFEIASCFKNTESKFVTYNCFLKSMTTNSRIVFTNRDHKNHMKCVPYLLLFINIYSCNFVNLCYIKYNYLI